MKRRKIIPIAIKKYLTDPDTDVLYWRAQSYQERLAALEEIRQEFHRWKYDVQPGFQRVYRIIKRQPG